MLFLLCSSDGHVNRVRVGVYNKMGIFEYDVTFSPVIVSKLMRLYMFNLHGAMLGSARVFNGDTLYLPCGTHRTMVRLCFFLFPNCFFFF
jgi:hypothetical protein